MFIKLKTRMVNGRSVARIGMNDERTRVSYEMDYVRDDGTSYIYSYPIAEWLDEEQAFALYNALYDAIHNDEDFDVEEWNEEYHLMRIERDNT